MIGYDILYDIVYNIGQVREHWRSPSLHRVPGTDIFMFPRDLLEVEDEDRDPDPTRLLTRMTIWIWTWWRCSSTGRSTGSVCNFLKELKDLSSMSGPDIADLLSELPVPLEGDVVGISMEDAVKVCHHIPYS